jgi:hypothetical protein
MALDSTKPALLGLRSRQLRQLKLTDIRDGRLHLDSRVVLLADTVRTRLAAYLDYRTRSWPSNPRLCLTGWWTHPTSRTCATASNLPSGGRLRIGRAG